MRNRKADHCPDCGSSKFRIVPDSSTRVCTGIWRVLECRKCGRRLNSFVPYEKKRS